MKTLAVILARAGSKGLKRKNELPLGGVPLAGYSIEAAQASALVDAVAVSSDSPVVCGLGAEMGTLVISRPAELAGDAASVQEATRHALREAEEKLDTRFEAVVVLYGNVPVRPADLIDRAIEKLQQTGCHSVQSVCPVGKAHPYWMKKLAEDRLEHFIENSVDRRQDLPPVHQLDGGIIALRSEILDQASPARPHEFLGSDRRAITTGQGDVVDVDEPADLLAAEAALRGRAAARAAVEVRIAGRLIAPGQPTCIIAEIGVNHDGSEVRAVELVHAAHRAGADAVKLQMFDPDLLLSRQATLADYQKKSDSDVKGMLARLQLKPEQIARVGAAARELGLGFIVTCFSVELIPSLGGLGVDGVKVASPDAVNGPLLRGLMELNLPMIVSTGACRRWEILRTLRLAAGRPMALMHCVSCYPTPDDQATLGVIGELAALGAPAGYSDHTANLHTGMLAQAAGACLIEKHLTHDRAAAGPDHAASFDPQQFAEYVRLIRTSQAMLGANEGRELEIEKEVRRISRQSVCAVRDLEAGQVIEREDLTVRRPGTGIPAWELGRVVGRRAARSVQAESVLVAADLADWRCA